MSLEEAIAHIDDKVKTMTCKECIDEHLQLKKWLLELKSLYESKEKE